MTHVKLTAKQEAFCQGIADGMTQAHAYRAAYNAGKMADKTIWEKASALMADGKVAARVAELKQALADKQLWTREMSIKGLVAAYRVANEGKNASGMTGAIKELNAMHGYNEPAKVDLNHKGFVTQIVIKGVDANDD
jgi:phage terminase small subunit